MPCLFVRNVPTTLRTFQPEASAMLYSRIAKAVGIDVADVEVHIENTQYEVLKKDGTLEAAPDIHIIVEWTGKPFRVKELIAAAIDDFFFTHGFGTDTTFRDSGPGTFFLNGTLIGPKPE